jgi:4-cresol dehydrogenase (hydroxylating)
MTQQAPVARALGAEPRFESALDRWRAVLGAERVSADASTLDRYARTTLCDAPRTFAVLRPARAEQLPHVLAVAREERVPLYPISRGRNWGWGDACPVTGGQVVLDLGDLDRILELDAELGYAVVEPGVTQGQLADALQAQAPQWWLESTNAGPDTSIVGNALERGLGMAERLAAVCGLEVVLPDGSTVHTGFGAFAGSRVSHLARWGVGPNIEGLFSQSNLGIVTRMGIWLMPRPEGSECCFISVAPQALAPLVDALRPLRLRGVLPTNVHLFRVAGTDVEQRWLAVGAVYGTPDVRAARKRAVQAALGDAGGGTERIQWCEGIPRDPTDALRALSVQVVPGIDDLFRAGEALVTGRPYAPSPEFVLRYLGGTQVQGTREAPRSADPLDNDYGFYFLWLTVPARGSDMTDALQLVESNAARFALHPQLTVQLPNGRAAVLVVRICFNRGNACERQRASQCHRALLSAALSAGFPPWRLGIEGMPLLAETGMEMALSRRLKTVLDPDGVIAPGRYICA